MKEGISNKWTRTMLSEINWHFKTPLPTHISTTLVPNLVFNLAKGKGARITMGERGDLGETQDEE